MPAKCSAANSSSASCGAMTSTPGSNVVDVYVGYLRKKLGKDRITSVRGMGSRLQ